MSQKKKNKLLDEDIKSRIDDARYQKDDEKEKNRHSIFYIVIIVLVTVSVLFSLLQYLI